MTRSNPIALLFGILVSLCLALGYAWTHLFPYQVKIWSTWLVLLYGSAIGFYIWQHGLRCARLIRDVALSSIATTAQGYVELLGTACQYEDQIAKGFGGVPVLWFRREIATCNDSKSIVYTTQSIEESDTPFAIRDSGGIACVLPYGAEIISARKSVTYQDDTRYTEEFIVESDPLYVVGDFSTIGGDALDYPKEVLDLVDKWRRDPQVRTRFDTDKNGRLDSRELIAMHNAAATVIAGRESPAFTENQGNVVQRPADDRMFLISTVPPGELAGHYEWWLAIGLLLFFGCGIAAAAMVINHAVL